MTATTGPVGGYWREQPDAHAAKENSGKNQGGEQPWAGIHTH